MTDFTVEAPPRFPWIQFLGVDIRINLGDGHVRFRYGHLHDDSGSLMDRARQAERQISLIADFAQGDHPEGVIESLKARQEQILRECEDEAMEAFWEFAETVYRAHKAQREQSE